MFADRIKMATGLVENYFPFIIQQSFCWIIFIYNLNIWRKRCKKNGFLFLLFAPLMQSNYALADQATKKELDYKALGEVLFLIIDFF